MSDEVFCAAQSLELGEPLWGTAAANVQAWIVLAYDGAWGSQGLPDSGIPENVVDALELVTRNVPSTRVQLVRRPDAPQEEGVTVLLSRPLAREVLRLRFTSIEDVARLDYRAWLQGTPPPGSERVEQPLFLVCVHGKRDRCCAQRGMPVYNALSKLAPSRVWQTTHLGGHRFAATLVELSSGACYGRVPPEEAPALLEAHDAGALHTLTRMRGFCQQTTAVQAAEIMLREQLGELALGAVRVLDSETRATGSKVSLEHVPTRTVHEVEVGREKLGPFPQSCGAEPKTVDRLMRLSITSR